MKTRVAALGEVIPGKAHCVSAGSVRLVLTRTDTGIYALENRCPHLGLPLGKGKIEGNAIVCPFHGSRFKISTGENTDWVSAVMRVKLPQWTRTLVALGKLPRGIKTFPVSNEGNDVFVTLR